MSELREINEDAQLVGDAVDQLTEALNRFAENLALANDGENQ